ncbi:MAG: hypothetical protein QOI38_1638 [Sphingomonadales bacterium]|jgi:hypothetical protein|nr:hypothetical protein [Sphingomonadales bacterium]
MRFDHGSKAAGFLLAAFLLASCRTMAGDAGLPRLLRLGPGTQPPAADAQLTGTLIRQGECLAIDGNGSTIVVWPRTGNAAARPGGGNVVVIWPRSASVRRGGERDGGEAGINVVVIWPVDAGLSAPVRVGERIELIGGMKDDVSGLALQRPAPRGCSGRAIVVRDFRPAPAR